MESTAGRPDGSSRLLPLWNVEIMRKVFADTLYWVALIKSNDPYVNAAKQNYSITKPFAPMWEAARYSHKELVLKRQFNGCPNVNKI
jgi:hypothetical protein